MTVVDLAPAGPEDQAPARYRHGRLLYHKPLTGAADVGGFRLEGDADVTFPEGRLRLANRRDPAEGQAANFVLWCPEEFPDEIAVSWEFWPLREPGLCILFFAARGSISSTAPATSAPSTFPASSGAPSMSTPSTSALCGRAVASNPAAQDADRSGHAETYVGPLGEGLENA